jgi:hypothetical protein
MGAPRSWVHHKKRSNVTKVGLGCFQCPSDFSAGMLQLGMACNGPQTGAVWQRVVNLYLQPRPSATR